MTGSPAMHDHFPGLGVALAAIIGPLLVGLDFLPVDWVARLITLVITGAVTGSVGFFAQRMWRNLLKRAERHLPSILEDPDRDRK